MGVKSGTVNNPNGRPKGAKNKVTADLRARVNDFLSSEFPNVMEEYKKLSAKDKLKFYTELMQYGLPKLQSIDMNADLEMTLSGLSSEQLDEIIERMMNR